MELVIVESPNKAKKIQQLLGGGYIVAASVGHIADLPPKEIGVEAPDFEPILELTQQGETAVAKLKKFMGSAAHVWLATDPDREGEAIAAHLIKFLNLKEYKRITFHEITSDAILKALQNPKSINTALYQAQKARRVIDRLVGYKVSPELSKLANKPLSAGRVQSVALRLIVEREREIRNFVITSHFGVKVLLEHQSTLWMATWDMRDVVTDTEPYILNKEIAEAVTKTTMVKIKDVIKKVINKKPPPPFITTTMQKAASLELGLDASETMQAAQKLFEEGLITYHRTDNPNLSDDCLPMLKAALKNMGYSEVIANKKNTYKAKINAQEAHEAIRPTDFLTEPQDLAPPLKELYKLIKERALTSQMLSSTIEYTTIVGIGDVEVLGKLPIFHTKSQKIMFKGWMELTPRDLAEAKENVEDEEDLALPHLQVGDVAKVKSRKILELSTKPPARFGEAYLIAKLEKEEIGRPATYAAILSNIKNRDYIKVQNKLFFPTSSAELIVDLLSNKFNFMEINYTKKIEEQLDEIASGHKEFLTVVADVNAELEINLQNFTNAIKYPCPNCQASMRKIKGKHGYFWGCSRFYDGCKATLPDNHGRPGIKIIDLPLSEHMCPLCHKPLRRIKGKKAYFWSCSAFEKGCKFISEDYNGKPLEIFLCPKCNKRLRRAQGNKNYFWSCSGFKQGCATTFKDANGKPQFLEINKE